MTFLQLQTLYWIVRLGGFSAAARHLNASQPAISTRIRQLELAIGAALFDREQRGLRLTAKGEMLYAEAERLIDHVARIRYNLADPHLVDGTVRLGAAELIAVTWLAALVSRLNEAYPKVRAELDVDLTLPLLEKLKAGRLDMVLLPGPIADSGLVRHSVGRARFAWMASPRFAIPRRPYRPAELTRWPIMTLSHQSNLHRVLEEWFADDEAELRRADVCNSLSVLTEMVVAGIGLGYLSLLQTEGMRERGLLEIIETQPPIEDLEYLVVYSRRGTPPLALKIAELAAAVSNFDMGKPEAAIRPA
ncbi:MAG: LysR family transcriptional regulator [Hyphomicrobiaceae bacterium]|nr:LysR family transcriptional regulator [Hyphomicrobiaceae bacterium]